MHGHIVCFRKHYPRDRACVHLCFYTRIDRTSRLTMGTRHSSSGMNNANMLTSSGCATATTKKKNSQFPSQLGSKQHDFDQATRLSDAVPWPGWERGAR